MLEGESTPQKISLNNLGFEAQDASEMLTPLLEKEFCELESLSLHSNPQFWVPESDFIELLKLILVLQTDLKSLNLANSDCNVYQRLTHADLPQAVIDSIQPTNYIGNYRTSL